MWKRILFAVSIALFVLAFTLSYNWLTQMTPLLFNGEVLPNNVIIRAAFLVLIVSLVYLAIKGWRYSWDRIREDFLVLRDLIWFFRFLSK